MKIKIQLVIDHEGQSITEDIVYLTRNELSTETLGLSLKEAKKISAGIQKTIVTHQITEYVKNHRHCSCCGKWLRIKGYHALIYRTLFGKLSLKSPRFYGCCQSIKKTFSPLAKVLEERTAPELSYLQSKWASLMSYDMAATVLKEVLPIEMSASTVYHTTQKTALRLEKELCKEQYLYIEGCQRDWGNLPRPDPPLTVGIDGGYVHARAGKNRKAGWFEVIIGKSMQDEHEPKRFGFVAKYDANPRRRLYEMLKKQGLQMNQDITFLSDGGDTVRDLQLYLSPQAEHVLDWFHITMRLTVMQQLAKNIPKNDCVNPTEEIERIKWYLWHGNVFRALKTTESLLFFSTEDFEEKPNSNEHKLFRQLEDFYSYIKNNSCLIPNYGNRYYYGEVISSAFVESAINEVVTKRMVKKQQMRWTQKGAHLLLQVRIQTLNNELRQSFCRWYPNMEKENEAVLPLAA
jgi:hypothetical protein